jgi:hypothetical protein
MLKHIEQVRGITVKNREAGIYELTGDPIPMQILDIHELTKEKNYWMQSLRTNLKSGGEIRQLMETYEEKKQEPLYQAVMDVIIHANQKEMEAEKYMCNALLELFADEIEDAFQKKMLETEQARETAFANELEDARQEYLKILIESAYELRVPKENVSNKLVKNFGIATEKANEYVQKYYCQQEKLLSNSNNSTEG